jgi:hypothetical protein
MSRSEADLSWCQLWFEPWRDVHASWLDAADPPALPPAAGPGRRLAYQWFCHRHALPRTPPPPQRPAGLDARALSQAALPAVALFLGMATCASTAGAAARWSGAVARPDAARLWQAAQRLARARPLPPAGAPAPITADGLALLGLAQMRATCEALQAGLWPRLRLRCDRALIIRQGPSGPVADAATVRHIVRAWRLAAAPPHLNLMETSHATE